MANLFKGLKPKAHLSSNGFDLSQKHVFSNAPGMLLPVACWETVPNDYFEINMVSLMRTMTMNTAAFVRGKQRFDFYFVPYSQLWHPFNQFITQREDAHSVNQKGFLYVPTVSLATILKMIFEEFWTRTQAGDDIFGYHFSVNAVRLLDMLGYGNYAWVVDLAKDNTKTVQDLEDILNDYGLSEKRVNIFRLAAYQHIWYDIYRNKFYDLMDRGLQENDYVSNFNFDDIPCRSFSDSQLETVLQPARLQERIFGLFRMRYVGWKKDLFTGLMPSQQFGAVSSVSIGSDLQLIGNPQVDNNLSVHWQDTYNHNSEGLSDTSLDYTAYDENMGYITADGISLYHSHQLNGGISASRGSLALQGDGGSFDVLSLYKAQMLQNWKQKTLRAGNMVDDNFEAHFGTSPYYNSDENVRPLGSFEAVLNIDPVETTAISSEIGNNKVGDIGAKAQAVAKGNTIKFSCRDYGVIMCVTSFVPEADYKSDGIDKNNTLYEQFDFFTPEFENIGLEAVETKQLSHLIKRDAVLGYAPRYWHYKGAYDKIHNGFYNQQYWKHGASSITTVLGDKVAWAAPKESYYLSGYDFFGLASFYVDPAIFDNVFGVEFNVDHDYQHQEDTFVNNVYFDVKAIRSMSKLGLPEF